MLSTTPWPKDSPIDITKLPIPTSWQPTLTGIFNKYPNDIAKINKYIVELIKSGKNIFPHPELLFNAFNCTLDNIKLVIFGQDPYYTCTEYNGILMPNAMGLAFSVSQGMKHPPSLANIFRNLAKYKHITSYPKSGDLTKWSTDGCLLLNATLTVTENEPNSHEAKWKNITDEIIKYISDNRDNVVFLLWGSFAKNKMNLIDKSKHKIIISSHPSPLSCNTKLGVYEAFANVDHFGEANKYLIEHNKQAIDWTL